MSLVEWSETKRRADVPDPRDLVALLELRAKLQPQKTAFAFLSRGEKETARLTYSDLDRKARAIAARLQRSRGFAPQARALLLYPAGLAYVEAFFGCLYAGVIATPAYPPGGPHRQRLQAIVEDASPAFIMTTAELEARFSQDDLLGKGSEAFWLSTDGLAYDGASDWLAHQPAPENIAFLQYTSGSTGNPRGVKITHGNLIANQQIIRDSFGHDQQSVLVGWLPLYHDMGLIGNILQPLFVGASAYLMSPLAFLERPVRWLQAISNYRAHTSGGPNFAYDLCARKITQEQKRNLDLSCWKVAFSGAEPVRASTLDRFSKAFAECGFEREAFFPCYGLAEGTLVLTAPTRGGAPVLRYADRAHLEENKVEPPARGDGVAIVGCGRAWNGHQIRIVDPRTLLPRADEEVGEIWVSGASIAAGYWNRPQETAEAFEARIEDAPHKRFLRTGDLGFMSNGEVFITGRLKDLIIIAGRNYYPQDFERALDETIDGVKPGCSAAFAVTINDTEAVVIVTELERGEGRALKPEDATTLFAKIRENIASICEIGPAEIIVLRSGAIPRTSSGKVRRAECRRLYLDNRLEVVARSGSHVAVANNSQSAEIRASGVVAALRQAFAMVAPEQRVQLATSFLVAELARILRAPPARFEPNSRLQSCGLSSLGALELKHEIEALIGMETPLAHFLGNATIAEIAERAVHGRTMKAAEGTAESICSPLALSPSQKAIWVVQRLDPSSAIYNLHLAFEIDGLVNHAALKEASDRLIERHSILRTIYSEDSEEATQRLSSSMGEYFSIIDMQGQADAALQMDMSARILEPFDLTRAPLLRVVIYTRSDRRAAVLICAHHICVDLWAMLTFLKELEESYCAVCEKRRPKLPAIVANYSDFVVAGRRYLESEAFERDWDYWRKKLKGELPLLALPVDRKRRSSPTNRGGAFPLTLDAALTGRIKDLARAEGATLFALLMSVYKILLYRYTNERDLIVGSATSGRSQGRFAPVVGNFVNPVALRTRIDPQKAFVDYLRDVRCCIAEAVEHQDIPFSTLVERLNPARVEGQWPIFQTFFVLHQAQAEIPAELTALALGEDTPPFDFADWKICGISVNSRAERFDLKLLAAELGGGLTLSFQYCEDVFDRDTIARIAGHFRALLEQVVTAPRTPVGALNALSDEEAVAQLTAVSFGGSRNITLDLFAHHLLSTSAERSPKQTALVCGGVSRTYRELETSAN